MLWPSFVVFFCLKLHILFILLSYFSKLRVTLTTLLLFWLVSHVVHVVSPVKPKGMFEQEWVKKRIFICLPYEKWLLFWQVTVKKKHLKDLLFLFTCVLLAITRLKAWPVGLCKVFLFVSLPPNPVALVPFSLSVLWSDLFFLLIY